MFFYENQILNPPNWFTNVKVIEITPNPGVNGTGPFKNVCIKWNKMSFQRHTHVDDATCFHCSHIWDEMHFFVNEMRNHLKFSKVCAKWTKCHS